MPFLFMTLDIRKKKMKEGTKASNLIVLPCMTSEQGGNSQFRVNTMISLVSLLELRQSNLSNPEAYAKPCQTSNMEYFAKIVNA